MGFTFKAHRKYKYTYTTRRVLGLYISIYDINFDNNIK